jgi:uncharacterized protein YyaL (SSP411 family)
MRQILSYQLYFFLILNGLFTSYSYSQINQNNLSIESSAYLLQHAKNPINWQRWDKKLYETNNTDNKLLVVSIGYSSCHWCHVMEKETFEDSGVASFMNQKFISIKVDREENPEIDNIYMTATQMMTGRGGWPLNVVCLPDGRPVYGGTYHTKEQWLEVLGKIQKVYENDKKQLYGIAEKVEKGIQEVNRFEYTEEEADFKPQLLQNEMKIWTSQWDMINGGEKQNQKFITPTKFNYILQYQHLNEDTKIKAYLKNTLENISNSGIVDHLEGGFYRYTIDPEWKIPHFEKMLYDNAQLLSLYANAYKEFKTPLFKSTVYKTFDFLQKRMENIEGGYFSAIDADNEQGEGRYYMFNVDEIKKAAGQDLSMILDYYQIELDKPIENSFYHLRKTNDFNTFLKKYSITNDRLVEKQQKWESQFEELKEKREFPLTDKKIITSWNAQMVSGLLNSFEAFGDKQFLNQAQRTYSFLRENLISGAELMHTFQANKAKMEANLEDYAFMITAALGLYQNTGNVDYLEQADELTENAIKNFETTKNPFFTYTKNPVMFSEIISVNDNVIPSANAIMAENLWTLGHLLEKKQYSAKAKKMLDVMTSYFNEGRGSDYSQWAQLITKEAFSYKEVVIVGPEAQNTNREIHQNYLPNVLFQISYKPSELPLLKDSFFKKETLIYVCEDKVCLRPSKSVNEALIQINSNQE